MRLMQEPDLSIVGEAGDSVTGVSLVSKMRPDVVILDVDIEPLDGIVAAARIREISPQTAVVIHTFADDAYTRARCTAAGACAFVPKNDTGASILEAIRQAGNPAGLVASSLGPASP